MFVFFNWLISLVCSLQFIVFLFALCGFYAVCWWLIDNLKSFVQVIFTLLTPFFQPQEEKSLLERYGHWAGKCVFTIILFVIVFYFLM